MPGNNPDIILGDIELDESCPNPEKMYLDPANQVWVLHVMLNRAQLDMLKAKFGSDWRKEINVLLRKTLELK